MSWLSDVGDFEYFNLGKMGQQAEQNPGRIFYGSADPASTYGWNQVLGTHDKPVVDQYGGAAPQRYEEAQQAGINTGPGASMHGIARSIVGLFAGNALGNAMSGASEAGGALDGSAEALSSGGGSSGGGLAGNSGNAVNLRNSAYLMDGTANPAMAGGAAGVGGAATSPGLLSSFNSAIKEYKPIMDATSFGMNIKNQIQQGMQKPGVQPPPPLQYGNSGPQVLSALVNSAQSDSANNINMADQARQQRRMARRGLL